ncbi:MAG: hypothetical protein JXN61_05030 [Sedimentisphaerales bacterium]|nr:hypothetical protein [Sedimentisphaerales bacterium]
MNEQIKRQIVFALDDDNEVMTAALDEHSDLDEENKRLNRMLIKEHEAILAKLDKSEPLTQDDLRLIRDANEIHLNDQDNLNGHHKQAVKLNQWLENRIELTKGQAIRVLEEYLDLDPHTPAKVYRALHTLWEEATPNDAVEEPAFDGEGKCLKCASKVSFADVTDTVVFVGNDIVKRYDGNITNRNCVRCTYPDQYRDYEHYDSDD